MNLVQLNERLKDLPMQVIQQYANGMNPEVPPYLALGELQRREIAQKQMATAQGGMQGPQPSVKEQVEQKAGLMAAQGLQQQQAMQQMAQQRAPGPVPAGVPQPEAQPEAMMARGGLARAPVRFDFQHGGIVAFSGENGSQVKSEEETAKAQAAEARAVLRSYGLAKMKADPEGFKAAQEAVKRADERVQAISSQTSGGAAGVLGRTFERQAARPPAPVSRPTSQMTPQQMEAQVKPPAPIADLKALAEEKQRQQGAQGERPTAGPAASTQQPAPAGQGDELSRLALEANRNPAKAMTPEEAMAQEGKFAAQYGLDKKFGEEERGLLAAMKQRQAQYAAGRPMAELGAVLRGFGQGYGGAGAAGERASQETFNADMAHQREMLNAINSLNKTNLETGRKRYDASGNLFGENQKSTAEANRARAQTLGQMSSSKYNADMHYKSAMEQMKNANTRQDMQEKRLLLDSFKARIASIDKELAPMLKSPFGPNKDSITALQAEKAGLTKALDEASGIGKIAKAPSAPTSPSGTTRMKFDSNGNPIK